MALTKSVKKVEIADDTVVDLKNKERVKAKVNFSVHKIGESNDSNQQENNFENAEHRYAHHEDLSSDLNIDRNARSPKFDQELLQQRMESFAEKLEKAVIRVSPSETTSTPVSSEPKDYIKVKFDKFVQLVASRDFLSVLERNKDEEIILSSNLLTELAGSMEEKSEKKTPVIFLVGLAIGVIITYLLINR